jgi:hypothetical protein
MRVPGKEATVMTMRMELVHRTDIHRSGNGGPHGQVVVKINAEVDEQVAPLVSALNEFDGILTVDSCQGDSRSMAYVYFTRSGTSRDLLLFVEALAASLNARLAARENEYEIVAEWTAGTEKPLAVLRTRPDYIDVLAAALFRVATTHRKLTPYGR